MQHECPKCHGTKLSYYPEDSGVNYDYKTGITTEYTECGCLSCGAYFTLSVAHDPFLKKDTHTVRFDMEEIFLGDEYHDVILARREAKLKSHEYFVSLVQILGSAEEARKFIKEMA